MPNIKNLGSACVGSYSETVILIKIKDKTYIITSIQYCETGLKIQFVEHLQDAFRDVYQFQNYAADTSEKWSSIAWDLDRALKDLFFELEENPL